MLPIEYSVYRINWRKYAPKSRQGKAEPEAPASGEIGFYLPPPPSFRSSTRVQCTIQLGQEKVAQVPHQSVSQSLSLSISFFLFLKVKTRKVACWGGAFDSQIYLRTAKIVISCASQRIDSNRYYSDFQF